MGVNPQLQPKQCDQIGRFIAIWVKFEAPLKLIFGKEDQKFSDFYVILKLDQKLPSFFVMFWMSL